MDQNTQQDKNQPAEDQTARAKVEEMLGPPPRSETPAPPKPAFIEPTVAETPPVTAKPPAADEEDRKERLLVIPPSGQALTNVQPDEPVPLAGQTITPTAPEVDADNIDSPNGDNQAEKTAKPAGKFKRLLKKWWHNRNARRLTLIIALVLVAGTLAVPNSRYFILNIAGVRSSAALTVLDDSTQLPLKNVDVSLGGQTIKTNDSGFVKIEHIKLGHSQLTIQKRAFANLSKVITIGWGSNPLGKFQIKPTGSQYVIYAKDWLTGETITQTSASGSGSDAISDKNGKILLTIDTATAQLDSIDVTVKADSYRDETFKLNLDSKTDQIARMVIKRKDVFVSNKSGQFDVYTADIDGKNRQLALAGSGLEQDDIVLVQHPTDNVAALVSTRVNARNSDGFLLSTLTLINLEDNTTEAIGQSEQIQIIGWIGNRLLFVQIAAGASADDNQRFRLISYDYKTNNKKQLAAANAFNDVLLNDNYVYYSASGVDKKDTNVGLIKSNADGSSKTTLLPNEVWNIFRVSYDTLNLATAKDWYEYTIGGTEAPSKLVQSPANPKNRLYVTSPDGKHSLWVDQRDGKGLLIDYDTSSQTDTTLETAGGLVYPVKWLTNDVLIYRIQNSQETADYVLNIKGGKAQKVTDLYNAAGINRWYYY